MQLPCPAVAQLAARRRGAPDGVVRALFLLEPVTSQVEAAAHQGRMLDQDAALELWHRHPWEPSLPNQSWPTTPRQAPTPPEAAAEASMWDDATHD